MLITADLTTWLTEKVDPSVRRKVYLELLDRDLSDAEVVAAGEQIGREGWVASILALQLPEGQWVTPTTRADDLYHPKYASTNWQVIALADLGASRTDARVAKAAGLFLDRFSSGPDDGLGGPNSELCFTGNAVRSMFRLGYGDDARVRRGLAWLVDTQKSDGGWHCFPSETGTLDCWEALSAFAVIPPAGRSAAVKRAIERGAEFYLQRELSREGTERYEPWFRLHYPVHYYYDLLVGLDVLTALGYAADPRMRPALDWLESRRRSDGRWPLDALHPDVPESSPFVGGGDQPPFFSLGFEEPGHASRWITATALAVLRRAGRA
ncbi:MAG: hypothetical protein L3K15_05290 [Thermoplasmata archaeon]|nr:hypothetical protein [Thermoplasmata archaeon]